VSLTINIYYKGVEGGARKFAKEMMDSGIVDAIRREEGNLRYEYFYSLEDEETVLLIDSWKNEKALDVHHQLPLMQEIMKLREKYDLHMEVKRFVEDSEMPSKDQEFIRK
jgi:hypothetical protein